MRSVFQTVGLIGRQRPEDIADTLIALRDLLQAHAIKTVVEAETATFFGAGQLPIYAREELGAHCDLIIVVGGDGSLLNAARSSVAHQTPVLGINRGRLGFLTDIKPTDITTKVADVLAGKYLEEPRFLLQVALQHGMQPTAADIALNDVVLLPGAVAHMIEFAITINHQFVCQHRADGLIVATPTGSTAYALSGGGPIVAPGLDAVVLVPMFPHTLSARPIVIDANSLIEITVATQNENPPRLSCDGQTPLEIPLGATIKITKKAEPLRLIHPHDYNYFETLRTKLHWHAS